jgi:hypothetical protein
MQMIDLLVNDIAVGYSSVLHNNMTSHLLGANATAKTQETIAEK